MVKLDLAPALMYPKEAHAARHSRFQRNSTPFTPSLSNLTLFTLFICIARLEGQEHNTFIGYIPRCDGSGGRALPLPQALNPPMMCLGTFLGLGWGCDLPQFLIPSQPHQGPWAGKVAHHNPLNLTKPWRRRRDEASLIELLTWA